MDTILAADIGGTHCRLALFRVQGGRLQLQKSHTLPTAQVPHTEALLRAFAEQVCSPFIFLTQADMLAVAIAGPLLDADRAHTSNAALEVDMGIARACGMKATLLCNDFVAQAHACASPAMEGALHLLPKNTDTSSVHRPGKPGSLGILGAGTGLGAAALHPVPTGVQIGVPTGESYLVVASEFGHTPFAFCGGGQTEHKVERAYEDFLVQNLNIPYGAIDLVMSGRGLCLLHQFFSGEHLDAPIIATRHLRDESGDITDTCRYFSTFLGRICRQWALMTLCSGGLYVTGGLAMKNPLLVQHEAFTAAFYDSPNFKDFLHSVPIFLNTNSDSGLWGAAWAGWKALQALPR